MRHLWQSNNLKCNTCTYFATCQLLLDFSDQIVTHDNSSMHVQGKFFQPASVLVGKHKCRWRQEEYSWIWSHVVFNNSSYHARARSVTRITIVLTNREQFSLRPEDVGMASLLLSIAPLSLWLFRYLSRWLPSPSLIFFLSAASCPCLHISCPVNTRSPIIPRDYDSTLISERLDSMSYPRWLFGFRMW